MFFSSSWSKNSYKKKCTACEGQGWFTRLGNSYQCKECNGSGVSLGECWQKQVSCTDCDGQGKFTQEGNSYECKSCKGSGKETKTLYKKPCKHDWWGDGWDVEHPHPDDVYTSSTKYRVWKCKRCGERTRTEPNRANNWLRE